MQQEENIVDEAAKAEETAAIKADLLKEALRRDPDLDPDLFGAVLEDIVKVLASEKVKEWNQLIEDYPEQKGKLYLFYPDSPNPNRTRGEAAAPSYRNLYQAMDRHGVTGSIHLSTISVPLSIIPAEYYPIAPVTSCPGVARWYVEKNGLDWTWKEYRDVINLVARQLAKFIHDQRVKRKHLIIVRKNSMEHDVVRTATNLLGYKLDVYPCPYPLWSEEAADFVDDVVRQAREDLDHLDI